MAVTGRSSGSSVLCPLSSSQRLPSHHHHRHHHHHHHHHHHQRSSASPCNINLRLKRFSTGNIPKPSAASSAVSNQKKKCLCSPTTHPGSFRCAFHRRLANEKIGTLASSPKRNSCGNTTSNSGLNLRKTALVNSLARIATAEAERFRKYLVAAMVKPSPLHLRRRPEFRPRLSRFHALHKDQD